MSLSSGAKMADPSLKVPEFMGDFKQGQAAGMSQLAGLFDDERYALGREWLRSMFGGPGRAQMGLRLARAKSSPAKRGMSAQAKELQQKQTQQLEEQEASLAESSSQLQDYEAQLAAQQTQISDLQAQLAELQEPIVAPEATTTETPDQLPEDW